MYETLLKRKKANTWILMIQTYDLVLLIFHSWSDSNDFQMLENDQHLQDYRKKKSQVNLMHKLATRCHTMFKTFSCITLFLSGRGHYGPGHHERPCCFSTVRARPTKIHDFVSVYVWMAPWKSFLGFVSKIFEKWKKIFLMILTSKGPPFGKKSKISKKIFFGEKIILFRFEFVLYMF